MIVEIIKNRTKLGAINFLPDGKLSYIEEPSPEFRSWIESLLSAGVTRFIDVPNEGNHSLTIIDQKVLSTDPNFPLALKEYLERSGYEVIEKHPEVEKEIAKLLAEFPNDNSDKKDVLKRLPEMSYLEQTTILEGLRALNNPDNKLE